MKIFDRPTEKESSPQTPKWCAIPGCQKKAAVVIKGNIGRCARHYMDEVDRLRRGATSGRVMAQLYIERQEQSEIGADAYMTEAKERRQHFLGCVRKI